MPVTYGEKVHFSQTSPFKISVDTPVESSLEDISGFIPSNVGEVAPNEDSSTFHIKPSYVGTSEVNIFHMNFTPNSVMQVRSLQDRTIKTSKDNRFRQINITKIDSSQEVFTQTIRDSKIGEASLPSSVSSHQSFSINLLLSSYDNTSLLNSIYSTAQTLWHTTTPISLNFEVINLPNGQLAEVTITDYNSNGTPKTATISIDDDANGIGWFIDSTPRDSSEFNTTLTSTAYKATTGEAYGKYDLLTAILHEMGHALGMIDGYSEFDQYISNSQYQLTRDRDHLDSKAYPYDLMNDSQAAGVRKLPSALDLQILNAIRSSTTVDRNAATLTAPLTSAPLTAILNGRFDEINTTAPDYGWSTRGDSTIINSHAVLSEESRFNSNFSQSFTIPEGAKYLQFTLLNTQLGASTKFDPADAFEAALLDANTLAPLAGRATGLTQTDAFTTAQLTSVLLSSSKAARSLTTP